MGELLIALSEFLLHIFIYSMLAAYKLLKFIFHKQSRKSLIDEWHTGLRDKIEIILGGLLLVGFVTWASWFFGSMVYDHYYPQERTVKEKNLDNALKKAVETDDINEFIKGVIEVNRKD